MIHMNEFNKGIISTFLGSFWWGVIGVIYFKYVSIVNPLEVVSHRVIWTIFFLFFFIYLNKRLELILLIFKDIKKTFILFMSGLMIFINWATWIYALTIDQLVEASFGYYIFPILSVFLASIFLKERLNFKKKIINFYNYYFCYLYDAILRYFSNNWSCRSFFFFYICSFKKTNLG